MIAFLILIPMLIFTFFVTVKSEGVTPANDVDQIIHKYFYYKNEKDLSSLSKLLTNPDNIEGLELQLKHLDKISLIDVKEETNDSISKAYLKYNKSVEEENLKVYIVNYDVSYNNEAPKDMYKNGVYKSWFFLTRKNSYSK